MTHYYVELALWMAGLFLAGCPLGAGLRRLVDRRRPERISGAP